MFWYMIDSGENLRAKPQFEMHNTEILIFQTQSEILWDKYMILSWYHVQN